MKLGDLGRLRRRQRRERSGGRVFVAGAEGPSEPSAWGTGALADVQPVGTGARRCAIDQPMRIFQRSNQLVEALFKSVDLIKPDNHLFYIGRSG